MGKTKPQEDESYTNITNLVLVVTVCTIIFSVGEVAMYFLYNFKVILMIQFISIYINKFLVLVPSMATYCSI